MTDTAIATQQAAAVPVLSADGVQEQVQLIQHVMKKVMKKDEHYGVIPGCGNKPSLLKAGAEKLCLTFRLAPSLDIETIDLPAVGHREVRVVCTLTHIPTGQVVGQGTGCCSTMESKYRYRKSTAECPKCGSEVRRSKKANEGWYCWTKTGGCGATFDVKDIEAPEKRKENPDLADSYNTVLKMAKKRAMVDATLTATAASDIFTQDIEELPRQGAAPATQEPQAAPAAQQAPPAQAAPATSKAEVPQEPAELRTAEVKVDDVLLAKTKKGSPYYKIVSGIATYRTFHKSHAEAAKAHKGTGEKLSVTFTMTEYGPEIVDIVVPEPPAAAPPATRKPAEDDYEDPSDDEIPF